MNGDTPDKAFEMVASEIIPPLTRYLRHYAGDKSLADDLLQETLVRVSCGLKTFEGRSNVKTWALAIATRVAADYFRHPEHRANIIDIIDMEESEELAIGESAIDQKLAVAEMNACIREVINALPEDYRAALVLHDLEELSARQIAEVCGITIPTVKIRVHRARKRLRKALEAQCEFYHDGDNVFRCDRKSVVSSSQ
ncbi:MAG: RNA polymerase sigma factor [Rhodomicrobium sp.]